MKLLHLLLLGLAGLVWWTSTCPVAAVNVIELPCGRSDGVLLCVDSFAQAVINTMSADSVILIYPGTYDFTEVNPVYVLASDRLNITGLGEPGSVVVNALGQALRLSGADVTMTNVTVLGGLDVRNSASLTRVIVDSSGFDRHGITVTNTTLLTMDSVTVTSGATADTHAIYAERSHISAVGPLTAHASGAGSHGIYQVSGTTNCASTLTIRADEGDGLLLQAETGSTQTFTVGGSLGIEAGLLAINTSGVIVKVLGSADVASNGSYAAAASAFGTVEFLNERPNVYNANKQFLMAQDGTIVLRHVLSNLTFDCDGGTISSVPYSHVVSPAVAAVCSVNRLAVVLLGDEDEVVIASNTEQQGLVMSRVDVNVSQVTFVNFQYYDDIDPSPISFKTCFFYLGHSLSPGVFDCPLFLERPGWRVTFPVTYQYLTGLGRTTVRAVSGPEVQPPAEPVIYSNQSALVPLALQLNASSPILDIIPSSTESKANVAFGNVQEVTPLGEVVCTADIQVTGKWAEKANSSSSAFQTFGFSSPLFAGAQSNTTRIEMEFTLFKAADNVTYAPSSSSFSSSFFSNYSFAIDPSLAKFSLSLLSWPWSSTNNTLRVKINIRPAFTDHRALAGVPQPRMTTLELLGQPDVQTNVRLVEFAFNATHELPVTFAADPSDSTVVLDFPYFGAYLYYDPDFSLLVGHRKEESGSGGGSGDTALVVAVSVVVPAAVLLVLVVLAGATAVAWWRRRQSAASSRVISFDGHEGDEASEAL